MYDYLIWIDKLNTFRSSKGKVKVPLFTRLLKYKPDTVIVKGYTHSRIYVVNSIRYVDEVVSYKDVDKDIQTLDFDIFAKGPDQNHKGLKRTEDGVGHMAKRL